MRKLAAALFLVAALSNSSSTAQEEFQVFEQTEHNPPDGGTCNSDPRCDCYWGYQDAAPWQTCKGDPVNCVVKLCWGH